MAMNKDLVFGEVFYKIVEGALFDNIRLFNAASNGAIVLDNKDLRGLIERTVNISLAQDDIIVNRDPFGNAAVDEIGFKQDHENIVKVFLTTKRIKWTKTEFKLVRANEKEAVGRMGFEISKAILREMIDLALTGVTTVIKSQNGLITDITGVGDGKLTHHALAGAARPMGDQLDAIKCWVMHSNQYYNLLQGAMTNENHLFAFDTVNVFKDVLGRRFIVTDVKNLQADSGKQHVYGLVRNACRIGNEHDYEDSLVEDNSKENIEISYKGEWTHTAWYKNARYKVNNQLPVTKALIGQAANWEIINSNLKANAGVAILCNV